MRRTNATDGGRTTVQQATLIDASRHRLARLALHTNCSLLTAVVPRHEPNQATVISAAIPSLRSDNAVINEAFRIAIGDLLGDVQPFKDGLLERPMPVILAGFHFDTPWTRDAAINARNGGSLIVLFCNGDRVTPKALLCEEGRKVFIR